MGAGRSGSTILTTLLGGSSLTFSTADLMQIYDYLSNNKTCGNGEKILESPFWQEVLKKLPAEVYQNAHDIEKRNYRIEHHRALLSNLIGLYDKPTVAQYLNEQTQLIEAISLASGKNVIIDSSKYANRALLLNKLNKDIDVKYIYNIRDVRGVVNSFSKNVQSPRRPLSAIFYYFMINLISQLVYWLLPKKNKLKVRYEDLMLDYEGTLARISTLINAPLDDVVGKINNDEEFEVGPVIEGNRMVQSKKLKIQYDDKWHLNISRIKQYFYYLLAAPIMILNRYKP